MHCDIYLRLQHKAAHYLTTTIEKAVVCLIAELIIFQIFWFLESITSIQVSFGGLLTVSAERVSFLLKSILFKDMVILLIYSIYIFFCLVSSLDGWDRPYRAKSFFFLFFYTASILLGCKKKLQILPSCGLIYFIYIYI